MLNIMKLCDIPIAICNQQLEVFLIFGECLTDNNLLSHGVNIDKHPYVWFQKINTYLGITDN